MMEINTFIIVGRFVSIDKDNLIISVTNCGNISIIINTILKDKISHMLKQNDILGVKGYIQVVSGELSLVCDRISFINTKSQEKL